MRSWGWNLTIVGGQPKTPIVASIVYASRGPKHWKLSKTRLFGGTWPIVNASTLPGYRSVESVFFWSNVMGPFKFLFFLYQLPFKNCSIWCEVFHSSCPSTSSSNLGPFLVIPLFLSLPFSGISTQDLIAPWASWLVYSFAETQVAVFCTIMVCRWHKSSLEGVC